MAPSKLHSSLNFYYEKPAAVLPKEPPKDPRCPCLNDSIKISCNHLKMFESRMGTEIDAGFNGQTRVRLRARTVNNIFCMALDRAYAQSILPC